MKYYLSAGLKSLSFFLVLPIATHLLSKAEVGKFFFWLAVIQLGAGVTTMGFISAVARKAYSLRITDYSAGVGVITALGAGLIVGLAGIAAGWLTVVVVMAWVARSLSMIGEARTIARSEINKLSAMYVGYSAVLVLISYVAAKYWRDSHEALLLAFVAAESLVFVGGLWTLRFKLRDNLRVARERFFSSVKKASAYGMPIMIAGVANMGLNSADRFIVAGFWDFEIVAEFSVMYTIAFASNRFITAPANMKIFPEFVRGHSDSHTLERIRNAAGLAWLVTAAYCAFVALLGPVIVRLVLSADYDIKTLDFDLVSAGSALFLLFTINSAHLKLRNQTAKMMLILFAALAISVSVSLLLVPSLGYRGASISTFISYACLAVWAMISLQPVLLRKAHLVGGGAIIAIVILWALTQ